MCLHRSFVHRAHMPQPSCPRAAGLRNNTRNCGHRAGCGAGSCLVQAARQRRIPILHCPWQWSRFPRVQDPTNWQEACWWGNPCNRKFDRCLHVWVGCVSRQDRRQAPSWEFLSARFHGYNLRHQAPTSLNHQPGWWLSPHWSSCL